MLGRERSPGQPAVPLCSHSWRWLDTPPDENTRFPVDVSYQASLYSLRKKVDVAFDFGWRSRSPLR